MAPFYEEELMMLLSGLLTSIPSAFFGIASYVLTALAIYTIARRRGLNNPWLAWVPVANCWLLGSLSDQYQYVVKGKNTSRRKWLLGLNILTFLLTAAIAVLGIVVAGTVIFSRGNHAVRQAMGPVIALVGLCLPLAGAAIASAVIRYMALYDVYRSLDPANSVLYLVLSVLIKVTEPFFLFFNRDKDGGMPPRKQPIVEEYQGEYHTDPQPVYESEPEPQEAPMFEYQEIRPEENKDYL